MRTNDVSFSVYVQARSLWVKEKKKKKTEKTEKKRKIRQKKGKEKKREEKRNKVEKGETCGKKNEERVKNDIARRLEICPRIFSLTLGVAFMLRRGAWLVS